MFNIKIREFDSLLVSEKNQITCYEHNRSTPQKLVLRFAVLILFFASFSLNFNAQETVDKTVATVYDGVRTELITYSDLVWQLALQPNTSISPPSSEDLNRALQLLINQRLLLSKLKAAATGAERSGNRRENQDVLNDFLRNSFIKTPAEFERRLKQVGFDSVKDDNFERIMGQRVAIDKYLDFRFRSFAVTTPEDEAKYYRETFVPEFRRRFPGLLMPNLDEKRAEIRRILIEEKVAGNIEDFLDDAKRRAEIVILSEV
jgi:hypothetical protein